MTAPGRRRNLLIQLGLTSVVVIAIVGVVLYLLSSGDEQEPTAAGDAKSIRVASSALMTKDGTDEPKVVVSLYEDFLCPACGQFEKVFGPTITQLIDSGAIAADYYMVAILDRQENQHYSSRAGGAAYCVAAENDSGHEAFQRFHAALYAQQPNEMDTVFPTDTDLIETARQAGASGEVPQCVASGRGTELSSKLAAEEGVDSTPTLRINGTDYDVTTPDALVAKVQQLLG